MEHTKAARMEQAGKTFVFHYGGFAVKVRYLSDTRLEWEQVEGPDAGSKGEEAYRFVAIRHGIYFFWWQEKDTSVATQVVDFQEGKVYTTWISPDKNVEHMQGTIEPAG